MARDSFLLRTDPQTLNALRRWADDELRSVNAQIEYVLRRALKDAGRLDKAASSTQAPEQKSPEQKSPEQKSLEQKSKNQASPNNTDPCQTDSLPKSDNPS